MFRKGLKPAYYDSWGSFTSLSRLREIMELKAAFPHVTRVEKKGDDQGKGEIVEYVCFFQTEEQKHDFLNKAKKLEFMKTEFHTTLGQTLGFPPKAVQFWRDRDVDESLKKYQLCLDWWGIRCVCHIDDLVENVEWIWENYPVTDEELQKKPITAEISESVKEKVEGIEQKKYQRVEFYINYKDRAQLIEANKQMKAIWEKWKRPE